MVDISSVVGPLMAMLQARTGPGSIDVNRADRVVLGMGPGQLSRTPEVRAILQTLLTHQQQGLTPNQYRGVLGDIARLENPNDIRLLTDVAGQGMLTVPFRRGQRTPESQNFIGALERLISRFPGEAR